jgi:hypothetical protein
MKSGASNAPAASRRATSVVVATYRWWNPAAGLPLPAKTSWSSDRIRSTSSTAAWPSSAVSPSRSRVRSSTAPAMSDRGAMGTTPLRDMG